MRAERIVRRTQQVKGMKNRIKALKEAGQVAFLAGIRAGQAIEQEQQALRQKEAADARSVLQA